jgi:replicative DNA helicase
VRTWLHPGHFARPAHGDLYTVMCDLQAAGKPIDPVTVSWEASCRGLHADAADLADGTGIFAIASARQVHHLGLLAQASHIGQQIQADSTDPATSATQIMQSATDRLHRLNASTGRPDGQPRQHPATTRNGHARPALHPDQALADEPIAEAVP